MSAAVKNIDVLRLWSNYLAALRNEVVVGQNWERGRADQQSYDAAAAKLYYLSQEVEDAILTGPIERLAQLLWNLGETAYKISGGSISRKKLPPGDPFLTLMQRFRVIAQLYGENNLGKRRIRGIVLRMQEQRVNELADAIGNAVERFTRIVRI